MNKKIRWFIRKTNEKGMLTDAKGAPKQCIKERSLDLFLFFLETGAPNFSSFHYEIHNSFTTPSALVKITVN